MNLGKYSVIILTTIAVALIVGGGVYFWGNFNLRILEERSEKHAAFLQGEITVLQDKYNTLESQKLENSQEGEEVEIVDDFINSSYTVIEVVPGPSSSYLIVAAERSTLARSCGAYWAAPNCYFFLDKGYGEQSKISFIGKWAGVGDGLDISSMKFLDKENVQFTSVGGDAGVVLERIWNIYLEKGEVTLIEDNSTDESDFYQ